MTDGTDPRKRSDRIVQIAAWWLLPVVVAGFIWLRAQPSATLFGLAQVIFLLPIAIAVIACERAYAIGPPGIERQGWGLVAIVMTLLLLSEGYFSWYQVFVNRAGPPSPSAFDALNLLAAIVIGVAIAQVSGVSLLGRAAGMRLLFDGIAFSAVTFVVLYRFTVTPFAAGAPWQDSARWAAYSLVGVIILLGGVWLAVNAQPGVEQRLVWALVAGLTIYAFGMLLAPAWRTAGAMTGSALDDAFAGALYLIGYGLVALAALTRLRYRHEAWRTVNRRLVDTEGVWSSTLLSLYVLVGVAFIGTQIYASRGRSSDVDLYIAAGLAATLALVARSGVTSLETVLARSTADLDTLTDALGGASFLRRLDETLAARSRPGQSTALLVFDMDGFARVNSAVGHAAGDAVLARTVQAALGVLGGRGELYRLSADEFAIIAPIAEKAASELATEVLAAIRALDSGVEGVTLSASLGIAGCDGAECSRDEFVRRANAAQAWAKYHGKDRAVRFDARIVRALGVEERLRAQEDRTGLEMARALASAADARDSRNYYHSRNVAALAVMLSEALGLKPEHVHRIEIAAMLHDCGKLGLVDSLLVDVLRSSRQQMAAREHSVIGEELVRSVSMPGIPEWVRHHHERWDGSGYPDGLAGEDVPMESRIIALADAYDAITSGARNRSPASRAAALQEIDFGMGSRFDPMLAEKFIQVVGETVSLGWSDEWMNP